MKCNCQYENGHSPKCPEYSFKMLSVCCGAEVEAVCNDKMPDEGTTWWNECSKCKKSC